MLDKISIGIDDGLYLDSDLIHLTQETQRMLTNIISILRVADVEDNIINEFRQNILDFLEVISEKERKNVLRKTITTKILVFYISDFYTILGIVHDTLYDALIETEKAYPKNFSEIIIRKRGLFPKFKEIEEEKVRGE